MLQQITHRHLSISDVPPPVVDPDGDEEEEEYFPTAPLDDLAWSKKPTLEKDLCIHMAPKRPDASYSSQTPIQPKESVCEPVAQEKPMEGMFSNMTNVIDVPQEVLFKSYFYASWM